MKNWWLQLEDRERRLVSIMAPLVVLALFYWGLWQPLHQHLHDAQTTLHSQKKLLNWTRQSVGTLNAAKGAPRTSQQARGSLSQVVSQLASAHKVEISRLQPQGAQLDVRIERVSFNDFLNFVQQLEKSNIVVQQLHLAASDVPGRVKVRSLKVGRSA